MNSIDDKILKFLCGLPVMYKDVCLVKSPFIKDIAAEGLSNFYQYLSYITLKKPDVKETELHKILEPLTDLDYLILRAQMEPKERGIIVSAFEFFTGDKPTFLTSPSQIVLGDVSEKRILNENNFSGFQDLVVLACAMRDPKEAKTEIELLDTDTPKVRELKLQMLKGRQDREKAKRRAKENSNNKSDIELSDLIGSLAIGCDSYNLLDIQNLTYYAFQDQLRRMSWHEEFNINTRASLAGAKLDKNKLSYWVKAMTFS